MPYLPAAAQELLFERIQGLTVTGSRVAVEALGPTSSTPRPARSGGRDDRVRELMAKVDPQREIPTMDELWYFEEREAVGDWFGRHGWDVEVTPSDELMAGYGRRAPKKSRTKSRGTCSSPRSGHRTGYATSLTGGMCQVPSRIDGFVVLGQYSRSMRVNRSFGAGSQLDSLSAPGESAWM